MQPIKISSLRRQDLPKNLDWRQVVWGLGGRETPSIPSPEVGSYLQNGCRQILGAKAEADGLGEHNQDALKTSQSP